MAKLILKSGVKWFVHPALQAAVPTIETAFDAIGVAPVCTSAHDGKHSAHSAHHQNEPTVAAAAIDLRMWTLFRDIPGQSEAWWQAVFAFATDLAKQLNTPDLAGRFDIVLEKDHFHLEYSTSTPNIVDFKPWNHVHATAEVRRWLKGSL